MAALTSDRKTVQMGASILPDVLEFPVAAATTIYGGSIVATNTSGFAVPGAATATLKVWGRCEEQVVNPDAAGAKRVRVRPGIFYFASGASADAIAADDIGKPCYVIDDNTVGLTSDSDARPKAGTIYGVHANGQVAVLMGVHV